MKIKRSNRTDGDMTHLQIWQKNIPKINKNHNFSRFFFQVITKGKYKIDHISKIKDRTKQTHELKNNLQINPHLPCKFGQF